MLHKTEGVYDCAPILNYDVSVDARFEDQLEEYLRGIALSAPHLADLDASPSRSKSSRRSSLALANASLLSAPIKRDIEEFD